MKKKIIIIIVSIILVTVTAFIVLGMVRGKSEKKPARIEVVRRGPFVVRLRETGNLEPLIMVEVRSNVEGEIEELYVDEGVSVVKGQKLLKMDEKQIREEWNQAKANYDAAKAQMDQAQESIALSSDRLESEIQLAKNSLRSSESNLEGAKARGVQQESQARISIANMESLLEQDRISLKKIELAMEQAKSAEKSAKAAMENAKAELDRKKELYTKKFVPLQDVENAQLAYASAQSQHESALKNIQAQKENREGQNKSIENWQMKIKAEKDDMITLDESIAEQIKQAEIQIEQAKERLALLEKSKDGEKQITELAKASANANLMRAESVLNKAGERLDWTTLISPMTGSVVQCKVEEGEIITSGRAAWSQGPPVMVIADLSKMVVKTFVHEVDIGKITLGQKAEIKIRSYPDDDFVGEVREIAPSGQFMDNIIKFEVIVMVTKAPKPLRPGMTADVDIIFDERDNVLQLPIEAVTPKETIQIKTDVKTEMANKLLDKKVELAISSYPDQKFSGKVIDIASARPGFSTSEVTIIMDGSPKELQPDTTRTAYITIPDGEKIPNVEARISSKKEYFVKFVKEEAMEDDEAGEKEAKEEDIMIIVGERTQNNIEVLEGIKEGDKIRVVPPGEEEGKKK